jgi:protein-tyrosine phosphatase
MGRIDVHAHLLPGIDDGCQTVEDSVECARQLVERGYSHCVCTPHIWRNLPHNNRHDIRRRVSELQAEVDRARIPLVLLPGGEINLTPDFASSDPDEVVTYALRGRHVLIDLWADRLPPHFDPSVRWFQSRGLTVILAHPERMRAVQDAPELADHFAELGVLLQGNFQCFGDAPHAHTRLTAERFLREARYFTLGTDLHGRASLPVRWAGFERVRSMVDEETFDRLTMHQPVQLIAA